MGRYFDDFAHSGMEEEDDIFHYGVLGMKWGIRRYQPYSYTGGSGKEVGEAKKLAKLSAKSDKLDKKINKLEKKRTNRFAIATNARVRGRAGDKQQKLIKKKAKVDRKIRDYLIENDPEVAKAWKKYKDAENKATEQWNKVYSSLEMANSRKEYTKRNRLLELEEKEKIEFAKTLEKAFNDHKKHWR